MFIVVLFTIAKKVEAIPVSIDGWMDKQMLVYTHSGILCSLEKEGNQNTCFNMNKFWWHYAKWKKPDTKGQIL